MHANRQATTFAQTPRAFPYLITVVQLATRIHRSAGIVSCNLTCGTCYSYVAPVSIVSDQLVNNKNNELTILALAGMYVGLLYLNTSVSTSDCLTFANVRC